PRRQPLPDPARVPAPLRRVAVATIVAAAMTSHAPNITATPAAAPEQRGHFLAGLAELRKRLAATRPDVVVMFVHDHVLNLFFDFFPAFCVCVGGRHVVWRGASV